MQPGRLLISVLALPVLTLLLTAEAHAVPILQLYVEGATYDDGTWTYVAPGSSGGAPFRLWAIGNVDGPGGKGDIINVRLAAAYEISADPLKITLTPSKINPLDPRFEDWVDPSTATAATGPTFGAEGTVPLLGDGTTKLPSHGEYGPGIVWQEFALGNFDKRDSPVANFIDSFPSSDITQQAGQISVYEITVIKSVSEPVVVHFDLYNHVQAANKTKYTFSPFSHDAISDIIPDADVTIAPEPPSVLLLGLAGCFGAVVCASRRRNRLAATVN